MVPNSIAMDCKSLGAADGPSMLGLLPPEGFELHQGWEMQGKRVTPLWWALK